MRNIESRLVCQRHDPDIWTEEEHEAKAITLCLMGDNGSPCPALAACLDLGTDPDNNAWTKYGVWGGVGQHKRDRIRAGRARSGDDRYQAVTFTTTDCRTVVAESSL